MARFDVYRTNIAKAPLIVDVQANFLSDLATRVAVPLAPFERASLEQMSRLLPVINILGERYVFRTTEISSAPASLFRRPITNVERDYREQITAALDFLFQGF